MFKYLFASLVMVISINSSANDESLSNGTLVDNSCKASLEELNNKYKEYQKDQNQEITMSENMRWFMGPSRSEMFSKQEKMNKTVVEIRKNNNLQDNKDESCQLSNVIDLLDKQIVEIKKSLSAMQYVENNKNKIQGKCIENSYSCNMSLFKAYKERLQLEK